MRPSTVKNLSFVVLIPLAVAAYLWVSWNTAGAQDDPLPICTTIPAPACISAISMTVVPTPTAVAPVAAWCEVYLPIVSAP